MGRPGEGGRWRAVLAALAVVAGLGAGAGCARNDRGPRVALLLPEGKAARYEARDRPYFAERVHELCGDCRVAYANAGGDASRQLSQVEAALANRAAVIVLDPVDARAARAAAIRAEDAGVPLVAYDRLIDDPRVDWYVGFDNVAVGRAQAEFLADAVAGRPGGVAMLDGDESDPNAAELRRGATEAFARRAVTVVSEVAVEGWNPARARVEMARALARQGAGGISGVAVANDAMAGAAIEAYAEAGAALPPVTGQDAELEALRRIVDGRQAMTVYKPLRVEAARAAEAAVALAGGRSSGTGRGGFGRAAVPVPGATGTYGGTAVPGVLLPPVAIGPNDLARVVTEDRFWPAAEVCAGREARCRALGIPVNGGL